jgi:UDP-N-acetylmuramoylalanine--D-glutamate ligase
VVDDPTKPIRQPQERRNRLAQGLSVVVGAGASGSAAARLIRSRGGRVRLLERNPEALRPEVEDWARRSGTELITGEHLPGHLEDADMVVLSPGIPKASIAGLLPGHRALPVHSELEVASWFAEEPIVAVTGTNGKTTTVGLIDRMLRSAGRRTFLGGNIGTPLAEYALSGERAEILVIEASSFQLQNTEHFRPAVGVLLNFSANHLDYHEDEEEYLQAKLRMFRRQGPEDAAVLPEDLKDLLRGRSEIGGRRIYFRDRGRFSSPSLPGAHNRANMEAAFAASAPFGVDEATAAEAVRSYRPYPHRLQLLEEKAGVLFVDDSKATTVDAQRSALESFDRPVVLLAGGRFKGGDPAGVLPAIRRRVRAVVLFGDSRDIFEAAWQGAVPIEWRPDLRGAAAAAVQAARPGDVVLLSPGGSSFDLFADYQERGQAFQQFVRELED